MNSVVYYLVFKDVHNFSFCTKALYNAIKNNDVYWKYTYDKLLNNLIVQYIDDNFYQNNHITLSNTDKLILPSHGEDRWTMRYAPRMMWNDYYDSVVLVHEDDNLRTLVYRIRENLYTRIKKNPRALPITITFKKLPTLELNIKYHELPIIYKQ